MVETPWVILTPMNNKVLLSRPVPPNSEPERYGNVRQQPMAETGNEVNKLKKLKE